MCQDLKKNLHEIQILYIFKQTTRRKPLCANKSTTIQNYHTAWLGNFQVNIVLQMHLKATMSYYTYVL